MAKNNPHKDSISFLSETKALNWQEFREVDKLKNDIINFSLQASDEKNISRSLIRLLSYAIRDMYLKNGAINIMTISRLLYAFKRYAERTAKNEEGVKNLAMDLRNKFITDSKLKENLEIAVQWADYLTRKEVR
jgi:hypothetical protein